MICSTYQSKMIVWEVGKGMHTGLHKHLFDITDYYRMAENGIFPADASVELIEGEVIDMAPVGSKHASVVSALAQTLTLQLAGQAILRVQDPIHLGNLSVPQPDLAVVKAKVDFYRDRHPVADDVLLLIEVSDSTADYDLKVKVPLYARHGIGECWLIDLNKNRLLQFTEPCEQSYKMQRIYFANDEISPQRLERVLIKLATLPA